jgi:hypothetical protein
MRAIVPVHLGCFSKKKSDDLAIDALVATRRQRAAPRAVDAGWSRRRRARSCLASFGAVVPRCIPRSAKMATSQRSDLGMIRSN